MHNQTSHLAVFFALCSILLCCEQDSTGFSGTADQKSKITIRAVEVFEQDLSSIVPSSKRLEEWKDTGNLKLPVFDVVLKLQNNSGSSLQDADFIALTTIEFVIAPTYLYQGDVRKILERGNWSRLTSADDVRMATVPYVKSGEIVELRIKRFNLNDSLAGYKGKDDTLWPWGLRVNVHLMNREMRQVALGQVTMRLIPADSRLPKN